jgi:DNA uptake protein ComE-like DNA-binding protein
MACRTKSQVFPDGFFWKGGYWALVSTMVRIRLWIRSFFGFSRSETNAFLILLPLMTILVFSAPAYRWWHFRNPSQTVSDDSKLDSMLATWNWEKSFTPLPVKTDSLFSFDPNLATGADFTRLGFSSPLAKRILHYRARGGKFRIRKDLARIYGMDSVLYHTLYPYILLPEKRTPATVAFAPTQKFVAPSPFDLNLADTSQLIRIRGIGPKLSLRIIAYRERLGGFVSLHQVEEVYGLDTAVIHQLQQKAFVAEGYQPKLIHINTADEKTLASLPYLRFRLAKAIVAYRFQHGAFRAAEDLKELHLVDDLTFQKIKPYISVKE